MTLEHAAASAVANSPRILPHLISDDVAAAVDWLTRAFGFRAPTASRHTHPDGSVGGTRCRCSTA